MADNTTTRVIGRVADDAANVATDHPVKIGGVANAAAGTVTEGDVAHLSMDLSRRMRTLAEGAGAADAAAAGNPVLVGAKANAANVTVHENDAAYLSVDLSSRLRVQADGNVADDAANAVAELPLKMGGVGVAVPTAATSVTENDKVHLLADLKRQLWVHPVGGQADNAAHIGTDWPVKVGGVATDGTELAVHDNDMVHLVTDLNRRLRVMPEGAAADNAAATTVAPVKVGVVADAIPVDDAGVTDGDIAHLTSDLKRQLWVRPVGGVADDAANDVKEYPLKTGAVVAAAKPAAVSAGDLVHLTADQYRCLLTSTQGMIADGAAATGFADPVQVGGVADVVLTAVDDGDVAHLVTDLYRRLRITYTEPALASWIDSAAVAADAYYPAEAGLDVDIYHNVTLTGKVITGADNTSVLTIEATNDEDATPANRDWVTIYVYDNKNDTNINQLASGVGVTTTFAWSLNGLGFKYVRANYNITRPAANNDTVIIKARYEV